MKKLSFNKLNQEKLFFLKIQIILLFIFYTYV